MQENEREVMPLRASVYRLVILSSLVLAAGAGWKWGG